MDGADTHRLRLILPYAEGADWSVEVLAIDPRDVPSPNDPSLLSRLPRGLAVHRVRAWPLRGWGLSGLSQRVWVPLWRKGNELLSSGRFDLVFFSTTEFPLHTLGVAWQRMFGIPFCMDFQDPWFNEYYQRHPEVVPPGGRLKFAVANGIHRRMERATIPTCAGYLAVSQGYLDDLQRRYGDVVTHKPRLVLPFPAEPQETEFAARTARERRPKSAHSVWRYVGRGGADMQLAASAFFNAWDAAIKQGVRQIDCVRFEAYGTSYAPAGQGQFSLAPLAETTTVYDKITELPDRLPYGAALRQLVGSDALVIFGSNDPSYTASKVYPYLLADKPLLAILHRASPAVDVIRKVGGAVCITFDSDEPVSTVAERIQQNWFNSGAFERRLPLNLDALGAYTAQRQAAQVGNWMRAVLRVSRLSTAAVVGRRD